MRKKKDVVRSQNCGGVIKSLVSSAAGIDVRSITRRPSKPPTALETNPKVKILSLAELILDDRNANLGTARGRKMLGNSLRNLGAGRSVLVDGKGRVIAGNKTLDEAQKLGMKQVAVIETDGNTLVAVQRSDLDLKKDKKAQR